MEQRPPVTCPILALFLLLGAFSLHAVDYGKARSLALEVQPQWDGAQLQFHVEWHGIDGLGDYKLEILDETGGSTKEVIPVGEGVANSSGGLVYTFIDEQVAPGKRKEYRVVSYPQSGGSAAYGHAVGGYELPLIDNRGGMLLFVDATQAQDLASELARLEDDLGRRSTGPWTSMRPRKARSP